MHTCDVRSPEEELGFVVGEEGRMSATLLLCQGVDLALELLVGGDTAGLADHLTTHHIIPLNATQQQTHIVPRLTFTQRLLEHLNTCTTG